MAKVLIAGLTKHFEHAVVLEKLDLEVEDGELVTLLGPSGCGKTTTLRCVAGLERPDQGEIRIGDDLVVSAAQKRFVAPHRRGVGMVFQSYALWPHMTVFSNVAYPLRVARRGRREIEARVAQVLALVGMASHAHRPVTALSGGQQQRVAVARALVGEPRVLLLDEPLSNLDAKLRLEIRTELRALHERTGTTALYVTHDQEEALAISDRVVVMRSGRIEQLGAPREIYRRPANRFVAEFVGFENLLEGTMLGRRDGMAHVALAGSNVVVRAACPMAVKDDGRVIVAVRAQDVHVCPASSDALPKDNAVLGFVEQRAFAGDDEELTVAIGNTRVRARRFAHERDGPIEPASRVVVGLDGDRAVVLCEEPAR
jgi:iron(III) transport system ATP-binding protein